MKIVADSHIAYVEDYFGGYDLTLQPGRKINHNTVKEADVLIVRSITRVDQSLLENTNVKFVGSVTAGKDHLDLDWLQQEGIQVAIATGFNAQPVADYLLSVLAVLQRKNLLPKQSVKAAVIGVGNVGSKVLQYMHDLGFETIACDPLRAVSEKGFISTALNEIEDCDLISLHVPLTRKGEFPTYHFIDKSFLQKQKPGCVLVNASRGAVINSEDLHLYGQHLEWCLDVFEHEPNIEKTILNEALIATPHIAGYSVQSKMRGIDIIYHALETQGFLSNQVKPTIAMPFQELYFSDDNHSWQDIILGIFNPRILTEVMRALLLREGNTGHLFDEMRHQFNYRHEIAFTKVIANLDENTKKILRKFHIKFV